MRAVPPHSLTSLRHSTAQANGETEEVGEDERIGLNSKGGFDSEIYGAGGPSGGFAAEVQEVVDDDDESSTNLHPSTRASINASKSILDQGTDEDNGVDPFAAYRDEVRPPATSAFAWAPYLARTPPL